MEISVAKSTLENILNHLQNFTEKKDASQITSHILFATDDSSLCIKATDFEYGLQATTSSIEIREQGSATANGKKILDIVKRLKDQEIILQTDSNSLLIKQGRSNFKLPMFDGSAFPNFPNYEGSPKIEISSDKLINSVKKIIPAIDTNNPKFELNGALIDIKEYALNFVATDTRRLAYVKFDNPSVNKLSIIIPKKAIIEMQKLFTDDVELYYNETNLIVQSNNYLFFTKLINGHYPDYERIIPKETRHNLVLPKDQIVESIKLINSISSDIKITIQDGQIIFESLSEENSEAKTECQVNTGISESFTLAVNSRYVLNFLEQIDEESFMMGLNEPNLPFVLKSENFSTIIMPIIL